MKAVDLFSGCGGLSLGLQNSGIDVVAAYENWAPAISVYKQNFSHPVIEFDLSNVANAILEISTHGPDMVVGGPPCQDFSSAGKRNESGSRGNLTICYADIVVGVRPKWFIMENVERIQKTEIFKRAKNIFVEAGYGLTEMVLDASLCNVPQKRKRMFLIGKLNAPNDFLKGLLVSNLSKKSMTIRDYLGEELNTEFYYRHARSYARRGVFSIDEPSPTIRGVNRPIPPSYTPHPGDATKDIESVRPLTSIERSYLQTFPSTFNWNGLNKTTLEQVIGNAVPVNLARYVGDCVMQYERIVANLESRDSTSFCSGLQQQKLWV